MTSTNIVDTSQQNGHAHEKSPEEIQLEIARTRSAITEDLLAISERLSPAHLRESAREMMKDAREEAKEMIKDAKDAAFDSLVGVKDRAVESVSEKVQQLGTQARLLGTQARRASDLTVDFVSANAVAVSLVGFGVGFVLIALQRRRSPPLRLQPDYTHEHYALEGSAPSWRPALSDQVRSVASHASQAVDHARAEVRSAASRAATSARQGVRHAAGRTRTATGDNRLAVLAVTVAAGLGFGLLWPTGDRSRPRSRAL